MQKALVISAILLFAMLPKAFASEAVSMTELAILDESGAPAESANLGDKLSVQSSLQNNGGTEQEFIYIVQVQGSAGYTVFLSWASGTLADSQTLDVSWEPEKEDSYIVQAFVWTSIDSPAPLSFAVQKAIVDLKTQITAGCGSAKCFTGTVTRITDGDTLRVNDIPIRLTLVNSPERGESGYSEATNFTSLICPVGSTALVDEDDGQTGGSYGRMVAKVYCGGKVLNEELLLAYHAEIYAQYCDDSEFAGEDWAAKYGC
jgi:endonuclease YncB( thermonuclease family)